MSQNKTRSTKSRTKNRGKNNIKATHLLFGHLIVAAVEVLLTLGEPLLEEGGVAASPRERSGRQSRELALQLLLLDFLEFDLLLFGWLGGRRHHH